MGLTSTTTTQQQKIMRSTYIVAVVNSSLHAPPRAPTKQDRSQSNCYMALSSNSCARRLATALAPSCTPISSHCMPQHPNALPSLTCRFEFDLLHKLAAHEDQLIPFDSMCELGQSELRGATVRGLGFGPRFVAKVTIRLVSVRQLLHFAALGTSAMTMAMAMVMKMKKNCV